MRATLNRRGAGIALLAAAALAAAAFAAPPPVSATLQPAQITVGESAQLTITSLGSGAVTITLPVVAGLEFRVLGQSRRIEIIHGATLATTTTVVRVTPQSAGIFTIPGVTPQSQPLVLHVSPDGMGAPPISSPVPGAGLPGGIHLTADGSAFMTLSVPKGEVFVGESVPVVIEVGMRAGFVTSVNGLPTLSGSDFTLNNLSRQPERKLTNIDGSPFTVLTWHSVLAAVKPGSYSISAEAPLTVRIRTRSQRDALLEDQLGDPFMQNFFGASIQRDIKVSSPASALTVLALPAAGRPADFGGAVGAFTIAGEISSASAQAGDPLTLRLRVAGSGNIDRVDTPLLTHLDGWKTDPPKATFKPLDAVGYQGEKLFEQPVVALKPGAQTLPGLAFSYFDPATRRYETLQSAPLGVAISPSPADTSLTTDRVSAGANATETAAAAAGSVAGGLRPDHAASGDLADSLVPLYLRPPFLAIPSLLGLAFAGAWLALRRHAPLAHRTATPGRGTSRAGKRALAQMQAAAHAGDAAAFLRAARAALVDSGGDGDDVRQLLALADEASYSGHAPQATDYSRWTQIVQRRLGADAS